jgi:hypothetical protein
MIIPYLAGVITASLIIWVYETVLTYLDYRQFKVWLITQRVNIKELNEQDFTKFYALWELSKFPNVEFEVIKKDKAPL